jgi:hypothetical protein
MDWTVPTGVAVSGNNLFVTNDLSGIVGEYDATTGAPINATLISGLFAPTGIIVGTPTAIPDFGKSAFLLLFSITSFVFFPRHVQGSV